MKDREKAESIAAKRVQLVAPLLADGLDAGKARELRAQICAANGISERTLRRHLAQYRAHGFEGLRPKGRGRSRQEDALSEALLEQAILLRREVPGRSVRQIIQILEWEGRAEPGQIKRSTLQERLAERGYSTRHMRIYSGTTAAARRFQRRHRNALWHSDIKYGPYLPIGPGGKKSQVYLVLMLDDATRFVLHGAFYSTLDQAIVESAFRQAIQKYGIPEQVYFDNGKQYRTRQMARTCSKLGIRLLYAKPYSPESTGKVERLNREVGAFLSEAALEKPQTLADLNERFAVWLSECHQNKPHAALGENMSPETAFRSDSKALRFPDPEVLTEAFLHAETRRVDKTGCISFQSRKYEVGLRFIGCTVEIIYDPADTTELTVQYQGHEPWQARPLQIGERTGPRPKLPEHLTPSPAHGSRLLDAAKAQHQERQEAQLHAVSYRGPRKGEAGDV